MTSMKLRFVSGVLVSTSYWNISSPWVFLLYFHNDKVGYFNLNKNLTKIKLHWITNADKQTPLMQTMASKHSKPCYVTVIG